MRQVRSSRRLAVSLVLVIVAVLSEGSLSVCGMRAGAPIVLTGELLPLGIILPNDVVSFVYEDAWHQILIQIDERDIREFSQIYGIGDTDNPNIGTFDVGITEEVYCDPNTFTGVDHDPTLDANDEIVFMVQDAGTRAATGEGPFATQPGSGLEIEVLDPLTQEIAYVYLFLQDGSLDPAAGVSYVDYNFHLLSGDYLTTYSSR